MIMVMIKTINIDIGFCLLCGKLFSGSKSDNKETQKDPLSRTLNHGIPKTLNPKI